MHGIIQNCMLIMYSYCNLSLCSQGRVEKYGFTVETEYLSEIEMNGANEFIAWSDGMRFYHSLILFLS